MNEEHEIEILVSLSTGKVSEKLLIRNETGEFTTSIPLSDPQIPPSLMKKVTQLRSFLTNITPYEEKED